MRADKISTLFKYNDKIISEQNALEQLGILIKIFLSRPNNINCSNIRRQIIHLLFCLYIRGYGVKESIKISLSYASQIDNDLDFKQIKNMLQANEILKSIYKTGSFQDLYKKYVLHLLRSGLLNHENIARLIHAERERGRRGSIIEYNLIAWVLLNTKNMSVKNAKKTLDIITDKLNNSLKENPLNHGMHLAPFDKKTISSRKNTLNQKSEKTNTLEQLQDFFEEFFF